MDGRSTAAGTAGGKRRAAGRNRGLARRQGHGLRGARSTTGRADGWTGGQTGKPTAQIEPTRDFGSYL